MTAVAAARKNRRRVLLMMGCGAALAWAGVISWNSRPVSTVLFVAGMAVVSAAAIVTMVMARGLAGGQAQG